MYVRELRAVHVFDVGPVTFPAYSEASIAYRSYDAFLEQGSRHIKVHTPSADQVAALLRLRLTDFS